MGLKISKWYNLTIDILVSVQTSPFFFLLQGRDKKLAATALFFKTISNRIFVGLLFKKKIGIIGPKKKKKNDYCILVKVHLP